MMHRALALSSVFVALLIGLSSSTSYYVSESGSDSNSGSQSSPWRSVAQVNRKIGQLQPGDEVLFESGGSFIDTDLEVTDLHGTASSPITFSSYGSGPRPVLISVWILGTSHLVFDSLNIDSQLNPRYTPFSSSPKAGSNYITISNCVLENTYGLGININDDSNWVIADNVIQNIGDSGILTLGSNIVITKNTITNVGWNMNISYGKHCIYAKGPNDIITYNDLSYVNAGGASNSGQGQAVSVRFHGANVSFNTIHDTVAAVFFFDYDGLAAPGQWSYVVGNSVSNVDYFFFYAPQCSYIQWNGPDLVISDCPTSQQPNINFVVTDNTVAMNPGSTAGDAMDLNDVPSGVQIVNERNTFTVGGAPLQSAPPPPPPPTPPKHAPPKPKHNPKHKKAKKHKKHKAKKAKKAHRKKHKKH